jgi:tRNA-specific 2-thiouridylase
LGDHDGLFKYVRGQSKNIPLAREKIENRVVLDMIPSTQTLVVGEESLLLTNEVIVGETNWIQPMHPVKGIVAEARLGPDRFAKCRVTRFEQNYQHIEFTEPQRNVIPGQAIVFYAGDEVLGGGFAV